jgi:putative membrane protein
MSDPRVFFAAERTLLAWIRTGITVMGLGFVVARFGLFLAIVSPAKAAHEAGLSHWHSNALGIALVLIGAFAILAAVANHRHYVRALPPQDRPAAPMPWLTLLVALGVAVIGHFLAAYLAVS